MGSGLTRILMTTLLVALAGFAVPVSKADGQAPAPQQKAGSALAFDLDSLRPLIGKDALARMKDSAKSCTEHNKSVVEAEFRKIGVSAAAITPGAYSSAECAKTALLSSVVFPAELNEDHLAAAYALAVKFDQIFQGGIDAGMAIIGYWRDPLTKQQEEIVSPTYWDQRHRKSYIYFVRNKKMIGNDVAAELLRIHYLYLMDMQDRKNVLFVKEQMGTSGIAPMMALGRHGSNAFWLVVQHADFDPVFQYQVLNQMTPMVESGALDGQDYAYLYDRVMLSVTGRQKFGTQVGDCTNGVREALPLEDKDQVDQYRKQAKLPPMSDYLKTLDARLGACP